ncbi:MAG: SCO family protein [Opitutales bacterium]|jgi:protein SCO1|nr:SCO family protein [Opitutales bacterium]MDG2168820.1 SCO family protein [Opitutales bacterium]
MRVRPLLIFAFLVFGEIVRGEASSTPLPYYTEPTFTPLWFDEMPEDLHEIPSFSLTDQSGQTINQEQLKGNIYIANFFFTACPGICPKMTANLQGIQESFANEPLVKILSHSVAPSVDTVKQLKDYAERNEIDGTKWHLLTGSQESIYTLARKSYFADKAIGFNKSTQEFLHTENLLLIDSEGRIRGVYNGIRSLDMQRLSTDIHTLLKETKANS